MEISKKDNKWLGFIADYELLPGMPCDCLCKGEVQIWMDCWQPHVDYNQAKECLEGFLKKEDCEVQIEYDRTEWNVKIFREHMGAIKSAYVHGQNLSELIVLCLLEARKRLA